MPDRIDEMRRSRILSDYWKHVRRDGPKSGPFVRNRGHREARRDLLRRGFDLGEAFRRCAGVESGVFHGSPGDHSARCSRDEIAARTVCHVPESDRLVGYQLATAWGDSIESACSLEHRSPRARGDYDGIRIEALPGREHYARLL